jgi:hypothetical protein
MWITFLTAPEIGDSQLDMARPVSGITVIPVDVFSAKVDGFSDKLKAIPR